MYENIYLLTLYFFDAQETSYKSKLFFYNNIDLGEILPFIIVYNEQVGMNTFDKFQNKAKIKPFRIHGNAIFIPLRQYFIKAHNFTVCSHFYIVIFSHRKKSTLSQKKNAI